MGPHEFLEGEFSDVPSHPHIGLATVTYLLEGVIEHRDSLQTIQNIYPGDVNWMTAGRGIVHAEKTPSEIKSQKRRLQGIQAWVALPAENEDCEAAFEHISKNDLPIVDVPGGKLRLIAGDALGMKSPVKTYSKLFYLHADFEAGASFEFSLRDKSGIDQEGALYLVEGSIETEGQNFKAPGLLVFKKGSSPQWKSLTASRLMLLGGESLKEHRRIFWNFVSTSPEKIEKAKQAWRQQKLGKVPGETDWVPLPGEG